MTEGGGPAVFCHPSITAGCSLCESVLDKRIGFYEEQLERLEQDYQASRRMVQVADRHAIDAREERDRAQLSLREMQEFHRVVFADQKSAKEESPSTRQS